MYHTLVESYENSIKEKPLIYEATIIKPGYEANNICFMANT